MLISTPPTQQPSLALSSVEDSAEWLISRRRRRRSIPESRRRSRMERHSGPRPHRPTIGGSLRGDQLLQSSTDQRAQERRCQSSNDSTSRRPDSHASRRYQSPKSPERFPFACPYSKHNPIKYSHSHANAGLDHEYRNCSTGYWTSVARLKQHLYRTHNRATRCCERCWQTFANDGDLQRHQQSTPPCRENPEPEEKMNADQLRLISARVQGRPNESWYYIYNVLFPEDPLPASPYAEWVTGEDMRKCFKVLVRRLPILLFRAAVQNEPQSGNAQLHHQTRFPTTIEVIQQALLHIQKEFGQESGLTHVFASSPTSSTGSSSSERSAVSASYVRPSIDKQSQRHARHMSTTSQYTSQMDVDEDEEGADFSSEEGNSLTECRREQGYPSLRTLYSPATFAMQYSSAAYTAETTTSSYEDPLLAQFTESELYHQYTGSDYMSEYDHSH